ncbi:MAG: hypothetical protein KDE27_00120 [Planctomycetes bacterium]|nr:hypothetical protein [Planctomycetota bacterium]
MIGPFVGCAAAQTIQSGWYGVAGASTSSFTFVDAAGTSFVQTIGSGVGGTISPGTSQSILHLPNDPDVFLIGGFGFVGEARLTSATTVTYTVLTNGIGAASQMSRDGVGNLWIADSWVGQVRRVAPNGTVTDMSIGPQPWGNGLNAGVYEPATGDFVAGGNGALFRLVAATTVAVPLVAGLGGSVSAVDVDPCTGELLAAVLAPANRLVLVDANSNVKDLITPGAITGPNGIAVDHDGNFVTGDQNGDLWVVDRLTGVPTRVAVAAVGGTVTGVAATRLVGDGQACAFGSPCGPGAALPWLRSSGPYRVGATVTTRSVNHQPGAFGSAILGLAALPQPFNLDPLLGTAGCLQYVDTLAVATVFADPAGVMVFPLGVTASMGGLTVFLQHLALDGAGLADVTVSNGLALSF